MENMPNSEMKKKQNRPNLTWIFIMILCLFAAGLYAIDWIEQLQKTWTANKIQEDWHPSAESIATYLPEMLKTDLITDARVTVNQEYIQRAGRIDEYRDEITVILYAGKEFNALPIEERYIAMRNAFNTARYDGYRQIIDTYHPGLWDKINFSDYGFQTIAIKLDLNTSDRQHYELRIVFDDHIIGMIDNYGLKWSNNTGNASDLICPAEVDVSSGYRIFWEKELMENDNVPYQMRNRYIVEGNRWRAEREEAEKKNAVTYSSKPASSGLSSGKKDSSYDSYDEGYEDAYENDAYDEERYRWDSSYAAGVDDAMEDLGEDW